ncbi:MAG: fluoride efflux transporter CrcB [Bacteroidota bacterium]|nr:fluoride efflux transporter CrcB [Bacteroidota bacterium]
MKKLYTFAWIGFGGAMGASLRYFVSILFLSNKCLHFPISTFLVNLLGCFFIGFFDALLTRNSTLYFFCIVGFLGSFTTYSTFSYDTLMLFQKEKSITGILYLLSTLIFGLLVVWMGKLLAQQLFS